VTDTHLNELQQPVKTPFTGGITVGAQAKPHIPGEEGIWVFIMGDMAVFALFFSVFSVYQAEQPALFNESRATLNTALGFANTLLLLTSSWFVIEAVKNARLGLNKAACRPLILAFGCGVGFSVIKLIEYSEKIDAGITLTSNDFYMFYYIFTGLHFVHLLVGLAILAVVIFTLARKPIDDQDMRFVEVGASYWHMVDVLWIVLFPLIYLMQ
jgi:nitric oxide reductase NorE protein